MSLPLSAVKRILVFAAAILPGFAGAVPAFAGNSVVRISSSHHGAGNSIIGFRVKGGTYVVPVSAFGCDEPAAADQAVLAPKATVIDVASLMEDRHCEDAYGVCVLRPSH
ncbi:hypothetical protein NAC44_13910 [Allorhizobium sp. BGMRC 0089]|uniref:hypothetical protein n=1 Tax=Allorhizobium sonneratiae TaxID=2934936 RepID=UPI0020340DD2|nr:hypothetical protein [Allorhizobium sonneratiae]MCM2293420.1 hypothetical protein [Allorhizobium sonneratiae]